MTKKTLSYLLFFLSFLGLQAQDSMLVDRGYTFDTEAEYQKGLNAISAFQYDKAADHFYECQRNEPTNLEYLSKLAWCYMQAGNYAESKIYFKEVLKKDSVYVMAISNLGHLYEKELNYAVAQKYYRELIQIDSTNSYYYRLNGFNSIKTKQPLQAMAYFNQAHNLNPKDLVVINELANLYIQMESLEYAEMMTNRGLELSENNIQLLYTAARIQHKQKSYENVITLLEKTQTQGDSNAYYQMILGVAYLQVDSLDKGVYQLERLVSLNKDSEHTHHYLSIAYDEKNDAEKSMGHLVKAIELAISPKASTYYEELAIHYDRKKEYKKALDLYEEAYTHSKKPIYLFYIARNTDLFYKDKGMAVRQYKKYLSSGDKKHEEYSLKRIEQLKEIIHQSRK